MNGFTLPETMICLLILTLSLPAAMHLLAHSATFWQRANDAYLEDMQLQNWLTDWQMKNAAATGTGQFSDGRNWRIENHGALRYWWVEASNVSPEEYGWYLPQPDS
ncbi:hypothetical protein CWE13_05355 [Aliidiomarina shirensis]|uniref:Uncharacterized protein n=2 Tax=Aliidiomarina shirensis TaxID=1048642 RepID=A0A432WUF4_9GAMM|nr:hypothetical protein CWE13_05355 [Aliidiomarina shirensis]